MENEIKELEEQLKNNKELYKIVNEKFIEYHNKNNELYNDIKKMETKLQNLKDQQCPKASDFPCLGYGKVLHLEPLMLFFMDDNYVCIINNNFKYIGDKIGYYNSNINENIHVQKCKFSDIKKGDYFTYIDKDKQNIGNYFYCYNICKEIKEVYKCENGLIKDAFFWDVNNNIDYVYKFTIKEN